MYGRVSGYDAGQGERRKVNKKPARTHREKLVDGSTMGWEGCDVVNHRRESAHRISGLGTPSKGINIVLQFERTLKCTPQLR
jgi:hypothetical protein